MAETARQSSKSAPRRIPLLALLPLAIFLVLAALFMKQLWAGGGSQVIPSALIGAKAPQIALPPLDGLNGENGPVPGFDPATHGGKTLIVNVWASWCGPCRLEHPLLTRLAGRRDVQLIGINYKDARANALRFLGQLGNPYAAVGVDDKGTAAIEWGVYGVPETFIVTAEGIIAYKQIGPLTPENLAAFEQEIDAAIKAGK